MRIHLTRTGGFLGQVLTATIDTESLPPTEAQDLETMVEVTKFFDAPSKIGTATPGADRLSYQLTIQVKGRSHTVEMGEDAVPQTLRPLIRRLMVVAHSTRRPSPG